MTIEPEKGCGCGMLRDLFLYVVHGMSDIISIALIAVIGIQIVAIIVAMGLAAIEMIRSMIYNVIS